MKTAKVFSSSQNQTITLGKKISKHLSAGDILCLFGDLGSGKTTFVKGLADGLKINQDNVHSPSFVLMNYYEGKMPLYHFDLYRVDTQKEIAALGYEEFLYGKGVAVVEWAERLGDLIPEEHLSISFLHKSENERRIEIFAKGEKYCKVLENIK